MNSSEEQPAYNTSEQTSRDHHLGAVDGLQDSGTERAPGNIDKIRDILFGNNMRDYEARFARLEAAVVKEAGELRESTRRRFETLEAYIKTEMDSLQARLKAERDERSDAVGQVSHDLRQVEDTLKKKVRDLEDQTTSSNSALREQLLHQSHVLADDIRGVQAEITRLLESRVQELKHGKTDRAMLADLLTEVAMRLKNEFQIPVPGE